ncbi:MAG TPA: hypothetical protein VKN99_07180 [Polyangia bacterium]|nr:hypothetical protein [Polyangia bacterium]
MALKFLELHAARSSEMLNDEWFVLENAGPNDFISQGCKVTVAKNAQARGRLVGTIDPGFVLHAGQKIRLVTGSPGKKVHGSPPDEKDDCKNYHLFLGGPILAGVGTVVRLVLNQVEMAQAAFDPAAKHGLAPAG